MVERLKLPHSVRAFYLRDESSRDDAKFLMGKRRDGLSHKIIDLEILPTVSVNFEGLVFNKMKGNKLNIDDTFRGRIYFEKMEKEFLVGRAHVYLIFIPVQKYSNKVLSAGMKLQRRNTEVVHNLLLKTSQ